MKMYLISDNRDTLVGMRLAGIKGVIVGDKREAEKIFDEIMNNKEIGILLLTERVANDIRSRVNHVKQKSSIPLIVEIPDRHGSSKDEDYITGYVRDSIGIKI